jgi:hypothetical protein
VWKPRRTSALSPAIEEIVRLLHGMGRLLMQIDVKLERIVAVLEEDE